MNLIKLPLDAFAAMEKDEIIHLEGMRGFFLTFVEGHGEFRGVLRVRHHEELEKLLPQALETWKKDFNFKNHDVVVKFLAPFGQEGLVESLLKKNQMQGRGRYYSVRDELEVYFQADVGSLKVSGISQVSNLTGRAKTKIKVLVVDDSETVHKILAKIIDGMEDIEIVGKVKRPSEVLSSIKELKPDVMTLDINMPEMDGVQVLKSLPEEFKIPAVIVSSINFNEGTKVLEALECGAVDYVHKPSFEEMNLLVTQLGEKLRVAAKQKNRLKQRKVTVVQKVVESRNVGSFDKGALIAIGASTGGTEAIREVLEVLPTNLPPIVITQHIPPVFSAAFAKRLDLVTDFKVREAKDGDVVRSGEVIIAAGSLQMEVAQEVDGGYRIKVYEGPKVSSHCPSVDVLFHSVAKVAGNKAVGVLLTGMGKDGAEGLLKMKQMGAYTIAQNEESCVVYGMPRAAVLMNAHCEETALGNIAQSIVKRSTQSVIKAS